MGKNLILDKPQTNEVIGNYNLEEVPIYAWNIASPRLYDQQILNDLALQDLMAKISSWTENPIVGPTISTVTKEYVDPDLVYTETLNTTGDIFAAMTARDNARVSNKNIEKNLANWALAKQFALNSVTPTKGLSDDLNNVGLATGIGMFSLPAATGAAYMFPTTAQGWASLGLGIAGSQAVDRIIENTTDYDGWTDMMLDKTNDWGDRGNFGRTVGDVLAYVGNPGGLIGGLSFANFSDDVARPVINNSIKLANFSDDLIPKQQVAVVTPEGYVIKVPVNQTGIEMTSNKWNWGNWPWSKPADNAASAAAKPRSIPKTKGGVKKGKNSKSKNQKDNWWKQRGKSFTDGFKRSSKWMDPWLTKSSDATLKTIGYALPPLITLGTAAGLTYGGYKAGEYFGLWGDENKPKPASQQPSKDEIPQYQDTTNYFKNFRWDPESQH